MYYIELPTGDARGHDTGVHRRQGELAAACAAKLGYEVFHLTNGKTAPIAGTTVIRLAQHVPMAQFRMEHHSKLEGDWLFIDTDVIVTKPVNHVFDEDFDIAVSTRDGMPKYANDVDNLMMPHNMGVVFSRCPAFWAECIDIVSKYTDILRLWEGDQYAFCKLIKTGRYQVKVLDGRQYNFAPVRAQLGQRDHHIAHYKGAIRKQWMEDRANGILNGTDHSGAETAQTLSA